MERPSLEFECNEIKIRWTYGLQLDIQRMIPDAEIAIASVMDDPYVRDYLIRRALTPIKETVTDKDELIDVGDVDMDPDQILDLLDWITGHILYFFAKSAGNLSRQGGLVEGVSAVGALHDWFGGLSFVEALCWAFDVCEGDLPELFWRYSHYELRQRTQLRYGQMAAEHLCTYNSLVQVLNAALGGGSPSKGPPTPSVTEGAPSLEAAVAAANNLLRLG